MNLTGTGDFVVYQVHLISFRSHPDNDIINKRTTLA